MPDAQRPKKQGGAGKRAKPAPKAAKGRAPRVGPTKKHAPRFVPEKLLAQTQGLSEMRALISPISAHGFRWPYVSGSQVSCKTGTATLHSSFGSNSPSGFVGTYADKGTQLFYLFRTPLRAAVILTRQANDAVYNAQFSASTTYAVTNGNNVGLPISYLLAADPLIAPHGLYLFGGGIRAYPTLQFVWMGLNDTLAIALTGSGTFSTTFGIFKASYVGSSDAAVESTVSGSHTFTASGTYTFTAPSCGYYAVDYTSTGTTSTVTVALTVKAGDCFSHLSLPKAIEHASWLGKARLLASSMLVSNVSSVMNKEGATIGASITDASTWYKVGTGTGGIRALGELNGSFRGALEKGVYTWLRPGGNSCFDWRECISLDSGVVVDTTFSLDDGSAYQVFGTETTGLGGGAYPGLDFLVTLNYALEYQSNDPWAELEYASCDPVVALRVLAICSRAESFTENPLHLAQIRQFLGSAGKFMRKHSVAIGSLLAAAFPQHSALIGGAAKLLQA